MTQQTVSSYFPYLPIHIYLGDAITYEVEMRCLILALTMALQSYCPILFCSVLSQIV